MSVIVYNPVSVFVEFHKRATRIKNKSGTVGLIKGIFSFLAYPFFKNTSYYLYKKEMSSSEELKEKLNEPSEGNLHFFVVTSNRDADQIEQQGYYFRKYPTPFNWYHKLYYTWLDLGIIACCTFVGKEFGAITWMITNQQSHNAVKAPPMKINYTKKEVMIRGVWVNPKYSGSRIFTYTARNRDRYLSANGYTALKATIDTANETGSRVARALGGEKYGIGRATRVLWFKHWTEAQLVPDKR
jgi:hypothetical protein